MGITALRITLLPICVLVCLQFSVNGADAETAASVNDKAFGTNMLMNPLDLDASALRAFDAFLIVLVVIFILNFAIGVRRNINLAKHVANTLDNALVSQFTSLGVAGGVGKRLIRDGATKFWYYATGRLRTSGFAALITLRARQDLFATIGTLFSTAPSETITVIAPIDSNVMDPVSVLLMQRRELARWRDLQDGDALKNAQRLAGEVVDYTGINGDFIVMAEHKDSVSAVLTDRVKILMRNIADNLRSLHVTDFAASCATWEPQCSMAKKIVRVEVVLPEIVEERERVVRCVSELVCLLVDVAANVKISPAAKKKALELRNAVLTDEEKVRQKRRREEMAAEKEAKKKEREEAVSKMSREKQAKYDEKMRKKAFKHRLKKASTK